MTTPVQPVLPVAASAPMTWLHLSGWHGATSGAGWGDRGGIDGVSLTVTEAVILQQLRDRSSSERNALVSALSEGQLCALRSPDAEGLPFGEQCELFDLLASSLDGHNLARVSAAYLLSPAARLWADSLYRCARAEAKQAFLRAWAPRIEAAPACIEVAAIGADVVVSTASWFAATALAGLAGHTREVDEALQLLAPHPSDVGRLQSVIEAAWPMHVSVPACLRGGAATVTCDPEPLRRLIDASACSTNPRAKASVFEWSAHMLGKTAAGRSAEPGPMVLRQGVDAALVQSLARLVCSDTTGILGALETDHSGGHGLVVFVSEMLRQGRTNELRVMTEQLRCGHDAAENPAVYFTQQDAHGRYRRAATWGYYVGAVQAACRALSPGRALRANTLSTIFTEALSGGPGMEGKLWLSGGAVSALQRVAAFPSLTLGAPVVERPIRALKTDHQEVAVTALLLPPPSDGGSVAQKEADVAYAAAVRRVFDAHGL